MLCQRVPFLWASRPKESRCAPPAVIRSPAASSPLYVSLSWVGVSLFGCVTDDRTYVSAWPPPISPHSDLCITTTLRPPSFAAMIKLKRPFDVPHFHEEEVIPKMLTGSTALRPPGGMILIEPPISVHSLDYADTHPEDHRVETCSLTNAPNAGNPWPLAMTST